MKNRTGTTLRTFGLSLCFALAVAAATPRTGPADVPELPMPDGSGNTPEMVIDLVPKGAATQAGKLKLSSLRGRVVLLDMFRSNCAHCQEHAPHIAALYKQYRQRGFTVLGLATDDKEDKQAVKSLKNFIAKANLIYPIGYVSFEVVAYYADSRNHGVPQMVLFGPDGKMVLRENRRTTRQNAAAQIWRPTWRQTHSTKIRERLIGSSTGSGECDQENQRYEKSNQNSFSSPSARPLPCAGGDRRRAAHGQRGRAGVAES